MPAFIGGLICGALIGFFTCALLVANRDKGAEQIEQFHGMGEE